MVPASRVVLVLSLAAISMVGQAAAAQGQTPSGAPGRPAKPQDPTTTIQRREALRAAPPRMPRKVEAALRRLTRLRQFTVEATTWSADAVGTSRYLDAHEFVERTHSTVTYRAPTSLRERQTRERFWLVPRDDAGPFLVTELDVLRHEGRDVVFTIKTLPKGDGQTVRLTPESVKFEHDPLRRTSFPSLGLLQGESFVGALDRAMRLCVLDGEPPATVVEDATILERYAGSLTAEQMFDTLLQRRDPLLAYPLYRASRGELFSFRIYRWLTNRRACHVDLDKRGNLRGWSFGHTHRAANVVVRLGIPSPTIAPDAFVADPTWPEPTSDMAPDDDYGAAYRLFDDPELVKRVRDAFVREWAEAIERHEAELNAARTPGH